MDLPEELVINIIARLPLRSIVRLKLVFREWKSLTESSLFRDIYHGNSNSISSSWSILHGDLRLISSSLEEVKLDLPSESRHGNSSFACGFTQNKDKIKGITVVSCTDGLVLLRLDQLGQNMRIRYYIGNPVLPQWIQLPPPSLPIRMHSLYYHSFLDSGLVTRMHNGVILGYKVVRIRSEPVNLDVSPTWSFEIFSSDTGKWSVKQVSCPGRGQVFMQIASNPVSLNGKLHWLDNCRRAIVHDFFSHDDQLRAICLPTMMQGLTWDSPKDGSYPCNKIVCTTSQGYCVLIDVGLMKDVKNYNVRIWRLKSDSWSWEKALEINMACVGLGPHCVPVAVNCFDIDIIYLWDLNRKRYLACNLRTNTKSYGACKDASDAFYMYSFEAHQNVLVYKEDDFSCEPRSCVSQFVPSFQIVPTWKQDTETR